MNLLKSYYADSQNNIWEIEKFTLPTRKGARRIYWRAECTSLNVSFQESKKYAVKTRIKWYIEELKNQSQNHKN
jgi:hypothetical protein